MLYLYLGIGGIVGTFGRYAASVWLNDPAGGFPWATLVVNLAGSFLLGFVVRGAEIVPLAPELRVMLTIGFCGAFTTFSTFTLEALAMIQNGAYGRAALYSLGSVGLGLVAVALGLSTAAVLGRPVG